MRVIAEDLELMSQDEYNQSDCFDAIGGYVDTRNPIPFVECPGGYTPNTKHTIASPATTGLRAGMEPVR